MEIRRLRRGDEDVVRALADREPQTALLDDERCFYLAAFEGAEPVGFVLAYELLRRHGDPTILFVYEIVVDEAFHRRGVGTALMREVERLARARGTRKAFVLTNETNEPAMDFYASLGGVRETDDEAMWDFEYGAT
jgi:ribosomal protein S18 acetylase RimI-like enzyme